MIIIRRMKNIAVTRSNILYYKLLNTSFGNIDVGQIKNGETNGDCIVTFLNGDKYVGQMKN